MLKDYQSRKYRRRSFCQGKRSAVQLPLNHTVKVVGSTHLETIYVLSLMYRVSNLTKFYVRRPFGGADQGIKVTSKLLKIKGSRTRGCNLTFDPWNQAIRSLRREQKSDQTYFLSIKKLDCGPKRFNMQRISDYPLYWLTEISGNDGRLAHASQMQVTDYSTRVNPAKSGCHPRNAGELEGLNVIKIP